MDKCTWGIKSEMVRMKERKISERKNDVKDKGEKKKRNNGKVTKKS